MAELIDIDVGGLEPGLQLADGLLALLCLLQEALLRLPDNMNNNNNNQGCRLTLANSPKHPLNSFLAPKNQVTRAKLANSLFWNRTPQKTLWR